MQSQHLMLLLLAACLALTSNAVLLRDSHSRAAALAEEAYSALIGLKREASDHLHFPFSALGAHSEILNGPPTITKRFRQMDYEQLVADQQLSQAFAKSVRSAILKNLGKNFSESEVVMQPMPGFVGVKVYMAFGASSKERRMAMRKQLCSAPSLDDDLISEVALVDGIAKVTTGDVDLDAAPECSEQVTKPIEASVTKSTVHEASKSNPAAPQATSKAKSVSTDSTPISFSDRLAATLAAPSKMFDALMGTQTKNDTLPASTSVAQTSQPVASATKAPSVVNLKVVSNATVEASPKTGAAAPAAKNANTSITDGTCQPECMAGRGICGETVCFCKSPYYGPTCALELKQNWSVSWLGAAGIVTVSLILGFVAADLCWRARRSKKKDAEALGTSVHKKEVWSAN